MNGIGGSTIAEAQSNMSINEFVVWQKFRAKRGSLNTGFRVEVAIAQFQAFWTNMKTAEGAPKLYPEDFAPHMDPRIITAEELARSMGAI